MAGWLALWAAVAVTVVGLTSGQLQTNLLRNPSFEEPLRGSWQGARSSFERTTSDKVDGTHSVSCTQRRSANDGPLQTDVPLLKGRHYYFEGYVKMLNDKPGKIWQSVKVVLQMNVAGEENKIAYIIAYRGFLTADKGWVRINGSIEAPMKEPSNVRLMIRGPDVEVGFLTDNVTLVEMPENPRWRQEADRNIENSRKANINVNVQIPSSVRPNKVDVEIKLKKHKFGFGAKIEEYDLCNNPKTQYEKIYNSWFNWATIQAYKWKFGGNDRFNLDFSRATDANQCLLQNGKSVRGHSILWDLEKNVPDWVKALDDRTLRPVIINHINFMMNLTKDKIIQMDVQNEHIHGHYYEERLQDPSMSKNAFKLAKAANPNGPVLYLNDFTAVTSGASTEDLYDLAMEYKRENVPIEGIGIQGHTKNFVKPDPTAMWRRLDRLAETGLDLMMTEFDIGWPDYEERADWLEDSIRAFFGHPGLKGVILWGFWNGSMRDPYHELISGPTSNNVKIVEPGKRWACLVKKEWMTREKVNMASPSARSFSIRGFKGDYDVIVRVDGTAVKTQMFTLGETDAAVNVQVPGRGAAPIQVEEEVDFVPECLSHREEKTVAQKSVTSNDAQLTCRTARSRVSGANEDDTATVSCNDDEVMTSCTSYKLNRQWTHKGQKMEKVTVDGRERVTCTAMNGRNSLSAPTSGTRRNGGLADSFSKITGVFTGILNRVRAYARCCKVAGLTCAYRTAGPSLVFDGAMAEARCSAGSQALGCSVHHPFSEVQGVLTSPGFAGCRAVNGKPNFPFERSGSFAGSACCRTSSPLQCVTKVSAPSRARQGRQARVACDPGYVMTGCHAHAVNGKPGGAFIRDFNGFDQCRAIQGVTLPRGSEGTKAYATCCRI